MIKVQRDMFGVQRKDTSPERLVNIGNFIGRTIVSSSILNWIIDDVTYTATVHHWSTWFWTRTYATGSCTIALSSLSVSIPCYISVENLVTGHRFLHLLWSPSIHRSPDAQKTCERTDRESFSRKIALCFSFTIFPATYFRHSALYRTCIWRY